ncbi:MAG: GAF domain-containing protein [Candidatus Krumholzibacteria bacterium]|nr:GAF domain-containing protein [Candidatus Krumholzibacteria bacterium]
MMGSIKKDNPPKQSAPLDGAPFFDDRRFYRSVWRNWFFLAAIFIITTIGLATAIPPLLSERISHFWPWVKTDMVLLIGLSLVVLAFVAYLAQQQRQVLKIHHELKLIKEESDKRLRQHMNRLIALTNISRIISVETDLQNIFDRITKMCVETFCCYRASLMLFEGETGELIVRSVSGHSEVTILNKRQRLGEGIAGYAAQHREPILLSSLSDYAKYPGLEYKDPTLTSAMVVPIIVRDDLVGVLNVSSRSADIVYEDEDMLALQGFASSAGACIRHTEHVNWMRKMVPHLADGGSSRTPRSREKATER